MKDADFDQATAELKALYDHDFTAEEITSYLLYPTVFKAFYVAMKEYGPVSKLPTATFFYGMKPQDEISVELEPGKILTIRLMAFSDVDPHGNVKVFFELNGQPRSIKVPNRSVTPSIKRAEKADDTNPTHIGAPLPGVVMSIAIQHGQDVKKGDLVLTLEAMKMETAIYANHDGKVNRLAVSVGDGVDAKDLLLEINN